MYICECSPVDFMGLAPKQKLTKKERPLHDLADTSASFEFKFQLLEWSGLIDLGSIKTKMWVVHGNICPCPLSVCGFTIIEQAFLTMRLREI